MNKPADQKLSDIPQIGDMIQGFQITEVRPKGKTGKKFDIYGVEGKLPAKQIKELQAHFAKPESERGFFFRPGCFLGTVS